jgi:membrane protein
MARRKRTKRTIVDVWMALFREHNLLTYASAVAFQGFVAAVSLVLLGLGVLGLAGKQDVWNSQIGPQIQQRVLPGVFIGMDQTVQRIFESDSGGLIAFASILALWEVSGAVRACMGSLNVVYETDDDRPWWLRYLISLGIAAAIIGSLIAAVLLIVAGRNAVHGALHVPWAIGRWILAILLLALAFGLLVRFAPAERRAKKWATAGTAVVVTGWIVESLIFSWYVTSVADFKTAVGTLSVFLVVTSYLYVGSIILLVGIELDELLRKDAPENERGLLELVQALFRR